MNKDEIIEMAIKAKILQPVSLSTNKHWRKETIRELAAFAKLVAQHEREACAKLADEWAVGWPHPAKTIALDIQARGQA